MIKTIKQFGGYPPPPPPSSPPQPSVDVNVLINALTKIREASLLLIIAYLLIGIGSMVVIMTLIATPLGFERGGEALGLGLAFGSLVLFMVILLAGALLALYAVLGKLVPGAQSLASVEHEFSTSSTLINVGYKWGLIMLIIGALTFIVFIGFFFMLIGGILLFIGAIGLIILCFKLNDRFKDASYLVAGILFVIGIFIPLVSFIAWILLYVALGSTINKLRTQPQALQQPPLI